MKMGVFLLFGRTKRPDLHRTARQRFSPLSVGSSVLDDLWIVVIILEQPAYALIVPFHENVILTCVTGEKGVPAWQCTRRKTHFKRPVRYIAIAMVHSDNRLASGIAMGIFATGVAASMLLILAHDRPFTGEISIKPDPLLQVMPE